MLLILKEVRIRFINNASIEIGPERSAGFLAKQMGTSVKMIEDHYGHVNPVKNTERILQGLPGWESIIPASTDLADGEGGGEGKKK